MPSKISNGASSTLRRAGRRSASGSGGGGGAGAGSSMTTPQGNAIPPPSPAQLTQDALELLRQFLMYLDPPSARLLPIDEPPNAEVPIPISDWNVIYSTTQPTNVTSSIKVSSYPSSSKNLFCVQSVLPGVSTRQFWTLMAESGNRRLWDNTVQEGGNWRWLEEELGPNEAPLARSIAARIEYLRMGAIFMVAKPRDMLLLSADVRLPPTTDSPLRMVSSCRSEVDPTKPPVKGYTRWDLGVGGFMVEELRGTDAIRVTQLSDLGELASWVPNSVVKMVASTMVPRSLSLISKAALKIQPHEAILGDTAPAGASLRDEIVVKNHERWSRGRGLPGQIGKGPLQARATAVANDQSLSASTVTAVESTSTAPSSHAQDSVRSSSAFTTTNSSSSSSSPSSSSWKTPVNPNLLAPPLTLQRLSTRLHDLTPPNLSPSSHQARSVVSTDASSRGYGGGSTGGGDGEAASQQSSSRPPSHGSPSMSGQPDEGGNTDVDETMLVSDHAADASSGPSQRASFAGTQDDSGEDSLGQLRDARELDERLQRFSLAVRATSTDEAEGSGGADAAENAVADDEDEVDEAQSVLAEALSSSLQSPQLLPKLLPQSPHRRRRSSSANLTAGAASSPPRSSSSASGAMPDPRSPTRRRMEKEASELSAMLLAGSDALVTALAPGARGIEELASSSSGAPSDDEGDTSEVRQQALRAQSGEGQEQMMIDAPTTTTAAAAVSPASKSSVLPTATPSQVKAQPTRIPFKAWDPSFPPSLSSSLVRPSMRRHASSNSSQPIVSTSSAHAMRSFSYSSRSSLAPPEVATASAGETAPSGGVAQQQGGGGGGGGKRGQRSRPYALALGMMAMLWASSSSAKGQQQRLLTSGGEESSLEAPSHLRQQAPLLVEPGHNAQEDAAALQSLEAAKDEPSPAVTAARRALMQRSVSNSSTTSSSSSTHHPHFPASAAVVPLSANDTPTSTDGSGLPPPPPTTSSSSLITPTSTLLRHHTLPPLPLSSPTFGAPSWKSTSSKNTMTILPSPPASPRIPGEDDERRRLSRANYRGNWKLLTGDAGGGGEEM